LIKKEWGDSSVLVRMRDKFGTQTDHHIQEEKKEGKHEKVYNQFNDTGVMLMLYARGIDC
jgi:hypothetical protein